MKKIANDLGYGSIKVSLDDERLVYPSIIAVEREQDILAPVEFSSKEEQDRYMDDFLNHIDVTISSAEVRMQGRFLIGNAAVSSGLQPRAFDINALSGKADSDLSLIFTLSMVAGKKVKEAYEAGKDLTKSLSTEVTLITALPVKEGKKRNIKDNYKERYLNKTHQVTFHNFAEPINVLVKFNAVYVANEGETAALYIASGEDKDLTVGLKDDLDANYPDLKDDYSADGIIQAQNIIVLDIGGGTVDVIIIVDGKVVAPASLSMNEGYDNALDEAVEFLQDNRYNFKDRTDLKQYLDQPASGLNKKRHQAVEEIVYAQLEPFCDRIVDNVSKAAGKSRAGFDEVIIVGGGSIPMKEHSNLRSKLVDKMKDFNGGFTVPALFVPKEKAQTLNLDGLEYIGKHVN